MALDGPEVGRGGRGGMVNPGQFLTSLDPSHNTKM